MTKAYDAHIHMAGRYVTVHLMPVSWTWTPGDGSALFETDNPGESWRRVAECDRRPHILAARRVSDRDVDRRLASLVYCCWCYVSR